MRSSSLPWVLFNRSSQNKRLALEKLQKQSKLGSLSELRLTKWRMAADRFVLSLIKLDHQLTNDVVMSYLSHLLDKAPARHTPPSSALTPFRSYWKTVVEAFTFLTEFPSENDLTLFSSSDGVLFARGYNRILYGGHGPYVEFSKRHICFGALTKLDRSSSPNRFYDLFFSADRSVKLYGQLKPVSKQKLARPNHEMPVVDPQPFRGGYADYKTSMYYAPVMKHTHLVVTVY